MRNSSQVHTDKHKGNIMSKSFTHAGVSKLDGEFKVRFANDSMRTKVLIKNGHTDIDIIELKHAMTKEEAVAYLLSIDFDNGNKEVRAALEAEVSKRTETPKAANKERKGNKETKKPKKAPTPKPSLDAIKARGEAAAKAATKADIQAQLADLEDAPY
jgi:hypothetical protein